MSHLAKNRKTLPIWGDASNVNSKGFIIEMPDLEFTSEFEELWKRESHYNDPNARTHWSQLLAKTDQSLITCSARDLFDRIIQNSTTTLVLTDDADTNNCLCVLCAWPKCTLEQVLSPHFRRIMRDFRPPGFPAYDLFFYYRDWVEPDPEPEPEPEPESEPTTSDPESESESPRTDEEDDEEEPVKIPNEYPWVPFMYYADQLQPKPKPQ